MSTAPHAALTHINTNTKILQMCIAEAKRALEGSCTPAKWRTRPICTKDRLLSSLCPLTTAIGSPGNDCKGRSVHSSAANAIDDTQRQADAQECRWCVQEYHEAESSCRDSADDLPSQQQRLPLHQPAHQALSFRISGSLPMIQDTSERTCFPDMTGFLGA